MTNRKTRDLSPVPPKKRTRRTIADEIFSAVVENSFDSIMIVDHEGKIAYANPACEQILGLKPGQLIGKKIGDMMHPDDAEQIRMTLNGLAMQAEGHELPPVPIEARFHHHNGQWLIVENIFTSLNLASRQGIVINSRDISAQKRVDALVKGKTHLLEMIATTAPLEQILNELVLLIESQTDSVRSSIALLLDHPEHAQAEMQIQSSIAPSMPAAAMAALNHYAVQTARAMVSTYADKPDLLANDIDADLVWRDYRAEAVQFGLRTCWSLPILGHQARLFGVITMYSPELRQPTDAERALAELAAHIARIAIERDRSLRHVRYMAHHDELTGLPNRVLLRKNLQSAIIGAQKKHQLMALMFIDLDHFKVVNDTLGHHIGDLLLQVVAARLHHCLRQDDSVARLGGDEFVITLNALSNPNEAAFVAGKVLTSLKLPFSVENHELHIGASVGIGIFPNDGDNIDALMRAADSAMYHAKASGRSNYQFFTQGMDQAVRRRQAIANDMQAALQRGEFSLQYQPQVEMASARIFSAEALLRWAPHKQAITPAEFIPIAEENGLILPIGEWVLREACLQLRRWRNAGHVDLKIAVNLSLYQVLQAGFAERLTVLLRESGLHASDLQLEITENTLMQPNADNIVALKNLSAAGVQFSIDDFGVGISNLPGLQRVPLHALKIDSSLVHGIGLQAEDMAIIDAIIAMAHSLHLEVIAEGVETREQADFLQEHGCQAAQGFYFGKPVSADGFTRYLKKSLRAGAN